MALNAFISSAGGASHVYSHLSTVLSGAGVTPSKIKLAFAILAALRGMPQIYSGDEIAMRGEEDPDGGDKSIH